ncbi:MAG: aromatic-ring-hydroxylating dioxygenase subunit beta [Sulfolobus sp.]
MVLVAGNADEKTKKEIIEFLYNEIELLEEQKIDEWINLLDENVQYIAYYRLTMKRNEEQITNKMTYFNDDFKSLQLRAKKFGTQYVWSEDPPSRFRYFITRLRIDNTRDQNIVRVKSVILLYITKYDYENIFVISYERTDNLIKKNNEWKILRREIVIDHSLTPYISYTRFL